MTEREIREVREQWDRAYERLSGTQLAVEHLKRLETSLSAECERLAEIIAEYDNTPIMTTDAAEAHRVVTEDDGEIS